MPELHLHIVSFDIPYPANYGGVIDVFYKIKALHAAGARIHLHCFEYHRSRARELEALCESVSYYPRKTELRYAIGLKPYIVSSRRSEELLDNLSKDPWPIIFEGLHSCFYLSHPRLKNRLKIYRESNIEHHYYFHLSRAENNLLKKIYFFFSGLKLLAFQKILAHADLMLTVSKEDQDYLKSKFPEKQIEYLPSFHHDEEVNLLPGRGDFAFYHGNLSVSENLKAVKYLIRKVFKGSNVKLFIAGLDPPESLIRLVMRKENVTLIANPTDDEMFRLIRTAQVNILVTFQSTGFKLKLLNALFTGRFCLVNPEMVAGTGLGVLCETGNTCVELRRKLKKLMQETFSESQIAQRKQHLMEWHSNSRNCNTLMNYLSLLYHPPV